MLQEWPDATDTGEESDSSVGRPDDMPAPAANHEVPHINVEVLDTEPSAASFFLRNSE